jgi:hypothetical protein
MSPETRRQPPLILFLALEGAVITLGNLRSANSLYDNRCLGPTLSVTRSAMRGEPRLRRDQDGHYFSTFSVA